MFGCKQPLGCLVKWNDMGLRPWRTPSAPKSSRLNSWKTVCAVCNETERNSSAKNPANISFRWSTCQFFVIFLITFIFAAVFLLCGLTATSFGAQFFFLRISAFLLFWAKLNIHLLLEIIRLFAFSFGWIERSIKLVFCLKKFLATRLNGDIRWPNGHPISFVACFVQYDKTGLDIKQLNRNGRNALCLHFIIQSGRDVIESIQHGVDV